MRRFGGVPVAYGEGLVDAVRALAPGGVDAAVDYVGGEAIRQSAQLVTDAGRTASNVDPGAVTAVGGLYCFVRPDAAQLALLAGMVAEGALRVEVAEVFDLDHVADAHRRQEEGHVRGKLVVRL